MRPSAFVAALVVGATMVATAQTTTTLRRLPTEWGAVEVERFIETDGDPATTEVLIWRYVDYLWRIVAVRADGTLCAGPWFAFIQNRSAWPRIVRVGRVDVAFLTATFNQPQPQSYYYEVALESPTECLP